ncbi:serine/threonine protein kinase, partial [Streptomyces sp. SID4926]|nr:serine/threonine protein kinase [Streptomyces sp. SID4926]
AERSPVAGRPPRATGGQRRPAASRTGGTARTGARTGTGRRPANPRLLRQRIVVFCVVTLIVALGIMLVQGLA